jgi:hypothetical protein
VANALIEARVTNLETMMADLMTAVAQTTRAVERLSLEMSDFKEEMREFKNEMRDFKQEMLEFKNEMRDFKQEMLDFKQEMREWRDKTDAALLAYREEGRRERRALNKQLGEIANKQGRMAEDLVAPSVCRILREVLGLSEDAICVANVRVRRRHPHGKTIREFDVIAECNEYVLVNETKSRLSPADVDHVIETIGEVREYFPDYRERRLIGSVATLYVDQSLVTYASKKGVLVLAVGDELMDVMNPKGFKPKEY